MQKKGFWASLFDMTFSSFITVKIVQLLYWLAIIFNALVCLGLVIVASDQDGGAAVIMLILAPIIFIILTIFARVYLETTIVLFKIADNTGEIAFNGRTGRAPTGPVEPQPEAAPGQP